MLKFLVCGTCSATCSLMVRKLGNGMLCRGHTTLCMHDLYVMR
jgi:hypothetical protein